MKSNEFIEKAKLAASLNTVYMKGVFGAPVTAQLIAEKQRQYPSWYTKKKVEELMKLVPFNYFGFDCVCLVKGLLWGWRADYAHRYGGATYKLNGVPDFGADSIMDYCTEVSDDFKKITPGEVVSMPGHCGIYIGNNLVIEATAAWERKVLISTIDPSDKSHHCRTWKKHGKINFVDYETVKKISVELPVLQKGMKINAVKTLQILLNGNGAALDVDGSFGKKTDEAVRAYQKAHNLDVDGSVGQKTWGALLA